jgi:hypothetical protein
MAYDPNDPADKAIVKKLVQDALDEAEEAHETAITGLKTKNRELVSELREARQGKGKPEDIARLEDQLEESNGKIAKLEKDLSKANKTAEEVTAKFNQESNFSNDLLVEGQLMEHLATNKVAPQFLPAVKALLKPQAQVKVDGNGRAVVVGEKSLGDYIKEWSQSDQGKAFVTAPNNAGGSGQGNNRPAGQGGNGTRTVPRAEYEAMMATNPAGAAALIKGAELVD